MLTTAPTRLSRAGKLTAVRGRWTSVAEVGMGLLPSVGGQDGHVVDVDQVGVRRSVGVGGFVSGERRRAAHVRRLPSRFLPCGQLRDSSLRPTRQDPARYRLRSDPSATATHPRHAACCARQAHAATVRCEQNARRSRSTMAVPAGAVAVAHGSSALDGVTVEVEGGTVLGRSERCSAGAPFTTDES